MNPIARIGFLIKGDYSDTEMYDFMDIVYYNGASYVAKKPTIGNAPVRKNEYWQIFAEGGTLTGNSDISDTNVTFEQASDRVNISSKEKLSVIMGKIKKWFTDLKSVAFSGSYEDLSNKPDLKTVATTGNYSDLSNKPTIPTALKNPQALTFTGGVTGSYDGSAAKSVKVPSLTNNLLATAAGTALDAAQGKVLDGKIAQINSNLQALSTAEVITMTANASWIKKGDVLCFKIAGRYFFQFIEVEFAKESANTEYKKTLFWTLGKSVGYEKVFLLYPIDGGQPIRLLCSGNKIYGHYSGTYLNMEYFGLLVM